MCLALAAAGVYRGTFPFRSRKGWTNPPAGCRHSGPRRVSRSDEPDLFWFMAASIFTIGATATALGVWFAVRLFACVS